MAAAPLSGSFDFHGNDALQYKGLEIQSFKSNWWRDSKAVANLIGKLATGKSPAVAMADAASALPANDGLRNFITKFMVHGLFGSLHHPPLSYKGAEFQQRAADGGNNNFLFPSLGKAGLPYAKTVPGVRPSQGAKPDPGDLFDMLLARSEPDGKCKESDLGLSSQLLYHADLIIHDIFRTNNNDKNISDTSSYLDLSPLYGQDRRHQVMVRQMKLGLLKPDSFAEDRLTNQPPGVCVYIIMYNRFHNYVAQQLLEINENGRYSLNKDRPTGWMPEQDVLDGILETILREGTRQDPQMETDPRKFERPDEQHWRPPPEIFSAMKKKAWATVPTGVQPWNWDPFSKDEQKGPRKSKIEELLEAAWRDETEKTKKVKGWPQGWLPSDDKMKDLLDQAWLKHAQAKQDEDLFQTARLITCGLYIQIAIHDYLRCLMRKHAENTNWTLDPRLEMTAMGKKDLIQRGVGNQVTVEFNVLYRFHSPLSNRDAIWTKNFIQRVLTDNGYNPADPKPGFPGREKLVTQEQFNDADVPLTVMRELLYGLNKASGTVEEKTSWNATPKGLPMYTAKGTWPTLRDPVTHKFDDRDLMNEITKVVEDPICQFGAGNIPKFFRSIEILGILQSRKWEMTTLNEFREFFGMERHRKFTDVNSDATIAKNLQTVYDHPDMIELYPGLFCEGEGRCLDPGSVCPKGKGTALWRGVFSDAVTLVRSDRFYTLDWNTDTLTNWGMNEVIPDLEVNKGGVMARLYQRAFPGFFDNDSIHLWQPFYTPAMNIIVAHDQGLLGELQDPGKIGVDKALLDQVMNKDAMKDILTTDFKKYADGDDPTVLRPGFITETDRTFLKKKQEDINDAFSSKRWYKTLFANRDADKHALFNILRFRRLRHVAKYQWKQDVQKLIPVSDYETIKNTFLADEQKPFFKNPGYSDKVAIPQGPIRNVLSNGKLLDEGLKIIQSMITSEVKQMFVAYFLSMAHTIRVREQVELQKYDNANKKKWVQVEQIDIIKDYAVPVVGRFVADFLGFGHRVKTEPSPHREYDENQIYEHFTNCQDYLTYDSDETRAFRRRKAFQKSIKLLTTLTEDGVNNAAWHVGELFRAKQYHRVNGDSHAVIALRKFGAQVANKLVDTLDSRYTKDPAEMGNQQQMAAAVMLASALDSTHKSIVMFARVMQFLLAPQGEGDDQDRTHWRNVQQLALKHDAESFEEIKQYVLEAQRLNFDIPLVRHFTEPSPSDKSYDRLKPAIELANSFYSPSTEESNGANGHAPNGNAVSVKPRPTEHQFLLEIRKASTTGAGGSTKLDLGRKDYLIYGTPAKGTPGYGKFDAKQLTIVAITALVKYAATLDSLREAHDTMGLIKEVDVPKSGKNIVEDEYRSRFMTPKWDELVPFPTTWCLRFDMSWNEKKNVYADWDGKGNGVAPPHKDPYAEVVAQSGPPK